MCHADTAHPGGGDEPGEVGGSATTHGDDAVLARQPGICAAIPATFGGCNGLAVLGVGDLQQLGDLALGLQQLRYVGCALSQGRLVDDQEGAGAFGGLEHRRDHRFDAAADEDRIRRSGAHVDAPWGGLLRGGGRCHGLTFFLYCCGGLVVGRGGSVAGERPSEVA